MKLSKEELLFIDTYLKNSDVIYTDVRLELTDHVASAIEEELAGNPNKTFYEAFKRYMVRNKKSLLKNHEEQQAKLRDKIITRFGKGFLAKEVLFFIVLSLLASNYLNLIAFKEYFIGINASLFIAVMLYYFFAFYKTKKTSTGKGLMVLMFIAYHFVVVGKSQVSIYAIVVLAVLVYKLDKILKKRVKNKLHENWIYAVNGLVTLAFLVPFFWFSKWSKVFVTDGVIISNFFFQLIMWYVLFKTLLAYKKELDIKYKGIFG
jgi:hypothetical protein